MLRARLHLDRLLAVERLERELRAERGLDDRHRRAVDEVVAVAHELGIGRDADAHVQVAGHTTARRGRTALREPQPLAVVDAGRHFDVERPRAVHATVAAAGLAGVGHDLARAGARLARARP